MAAGRENLPPGPQHTRTPAPAERLASGWQYVGAGNGLSAMVSANACRHGITRRVKIFSVSWRAALTLNRPFCYHGTAGSAQVSP